MVYRLLLRVKYMTLDQRSCICLWFPVAEIFFCRHLLHDFTSIYRSLAVFGHYDKVAVWYLMNHLAVREVKRVHECGYLPKQAVIAYGFCFAVSVATLLAKADSLVKFLADTRE